MRWLWISCLLLASLLPLSAEDWTTEDGKTYKNVTVLGQEDDGVRITYDGGVGKIPYYELPADLQKRFGQDIDSLAAKKHAVDQAINDAIHSAIDAQSMVMPILPPIAPQQGAVPGGYSPQFATPNTANTPTGPAGEGSPATGPNAAPGATPGGPLSAPGAPSGTITAASGAPGAAGAPGNSSASNVPSKTAPSGAPGATTPGAPGHSGSITVTNPGAHGAVPGGAPNAGPNVSLPELEEPLPASSTPEPSGVTGAGGRQLQLAVANYSYNSTLDVCYLDSPAIDAYPDPAPKTPTSGGSSLTFRIVTDGRTPQVPDRFEVTFLSVGGDGADLSTRAIVFSTDAGVITVDDSQRKDSGALPGSSGQHVQYASFYMPSAQVRQLCSGKPISFSIGPTKYRVDEHGATVLHSYFTDADSLQPATSSILHTVYKLLGRIPSFFSIISTICEYVILGSFGLLVAASIAAFILGISRFIKM